MSLLVSVQTDVSDLGCRNQSLKSTDHSKSCTENRYNRKISSCDDRSHAFLDRSLYTYILGRKIFQSLISHEHGDLFNKCTEFGSSGVLISEL